MYDDKEYILRILEESFPDNDAVIFSVGKSKRRQRALARYMWKYGELRKAWRLSEDKSAAILYYVSSTRVNKLQEWWNEWLLALFGIPLRRLPAVIARAGKISHMRNQQGTHIHCWYLGALKHGRTGSAARELYRELFAHADALKLPVLAETAMEQNKAVYEYIGFVTYQNLRAGGLTTYLLRR